MKIVLVSWEDSTAYGSVWQALDGMDWSLHKCHSAGYLIKESKDFVILVQTVCDDNDDILNALVIPRGCIKKIKELK